MKIINCIGLFFYLLYIGNVFNQWLEKHMLSCPSKKYLHIECPGCGFQRSFIALIKGNVLESFHLYLATIPLLLIFLFTILHLKYNFKNGGNTIKILQIITGGIILVSYIYKIVNHQTTA